MSAPHYNPIQRYPSRVVRLLAVGCLGSPQAAWQINKFHFALRLELLLTQPGQAPRSAMKVPVLLPTNILAWFIFTADDEFAGVDIDNCRDLETGLIHPLAQAIIDQTNSYAEISLSETGVKIIVCGMLATNIGNTPYPDAPVSRRRAHSNQHAID